MKILKFLRQLFCTHPFDSWIKIYSKTHHEKTKKHRGFEFVYQANTQKCGLCGKIIDDSGWIFK